ncbi:unnamed protein product [Bursaphelenchus xylophilus]|uniref:(pine wood nematode) hypothetical protein n=1 Tax=Bursaphelenchus xylophilus TaxID=6326 RepID=A0A1I7RUP3_BURXY|nr:unnamed protein product [Bursaphelenchus xylophilus]CAG9114287.1 unnamed protein product [Bursaphelenchus xylophilus]
MIYENAIASITHYSLPITTALESFCAPLILYLTVYHSAQMKRYRYFIMNNVIWNCLLNWASCIYRPAYIFPAPCATFEIAIHNTWFTGVSSVVLLFIVVNAETSVVWSVLYRFFMSYPGWISDFVEKRRLAIVLFVFAQIFVDFLVLWPFFVYKRPTAEQEQFLKEAPYFWPYEPSLGYFCSMDKELLIEIVFGGVIMLMCFFAMGTVVFIVLCYRVIVVNKDNGEFFAGSLHRMHKILFKAVAFQVLVGFIFLLFPTVVILFVFYAQWEEGTTIAAVCLVLVQAHGCADFFTMIYFIVPYRRQLLKFFGKATSKVALADPAT